MRIIYIIVIFCFPSISLGQEDDNIFSRSPYLQLATDSSIHIVWRTKIKINPIIRYGKDLGDLNKKIGSELILERRTVDESDESINDELSLFDAPKGTRQFEAKIPNLDPNSTYYYSVFDGEKRLTPKDSSYHFKTHPKPGTKSPLYFWVVGDSGTGGENQAKVHSAMRKYNQFKKLKLDMYIHVGDMAYNSGTDDEFSERFSKCMNRPCATQYVGLQWVTMKEGLQKEKMVSDLIMMHIFVLRQLKQVDYLREKKPTILSIMAKFISLFLTPMILTEDRLEPWLNGSKQILKKQKPNGSWHISIIPHTPRGLMIATRNNNS